MTAAPLLDDPDAPVVDVVVPVLNEVRDLEPSVRRLRTYLDTRFPFAARVTIADNGSTDGTWDVARSLAAELDGVRALHLDARGRGRALRAAWTASDATVVAYTDVDLSTDLDALLPLVAPLLSGHSDVAIGSRLATGARVVRGPKREFISRSYNLLLRLALGARFRDAQCGFKAVRADVAARLLPDVADQGWFFDTELLVLAQRRGLRIHELPVDWVDDPDSRVDVLRTAVDDLRGIWRLLWHRGAPSGALGGQLGRFAAVGVASTLAYLVLFSFLRGVAPAAVANGLALAVTAVANTAANRRLTFGVRGQRGLARDHFGGIAALALALALTNLTLWALLVVDRHASRGTELAALIVANLGATLARFLFLRAWIHHPRRARAVEPA